MPIDLQKLDNQLILEEGLFLSPYKDPKGFLTVGVGRNLDANPLTPAEIAVCGSNGRAGPITKEGAMLCLHNDEKTVIKLLDIHVPWWEALDEIRARVMAILCFNMGWRSTDDRHGLSTFKHFLEDMQDTEFALAAYELKNSLWYNEVGSRGRRLYKMVSTGQDYTT